MYSPNTILAGLSRSTFSAAGSWRGKTVVVTLGAQTMAPMSDTRLAVEPSQETSVMVVDVFIMAVALLKPSY